MSELLNRIKNNEERRKRGKVGMVDGQRLQLKKLFS